MDFQQGLITTIHEYGVTSGSKENLLANLNKRPTSILIPCLFEEFSKPALTTIKNCLKELAGLNKLVIALSATSINQAQQAKAFFQDMPFPVHVQWTDSPAVLDLLEIQEQNGLELVVPQGKGWAVWQGIGIASQTSDVIGLFDADIKTFKPSYPLRLLQPLLDNSHGLSYVKAFYSRLSHENNSMQGRVTRLFVGPLLTGLEKLLGSGPYLQYLQAFRYPLSGEFAFSKDLAINLRIPCNWELEIGLLSEVYRKVQMSQIAQVDLGLFDHKHQSIGNSSNQGLQRMCSEIFTTILRGLMENQSQLLTTSQLSTLEVLYTQIGEERVQQFAIDSAINEIPYDRHAEELIVHRFSSLIKPSANEFLKSPITKQLPSWSRVLSFESNFQNDLKTAGTI